MAYGSPARIQPQILKQLNIDRAKSDDLKSISAVIKAHRNKSFKFDKVNRVLCLWLKNNPNRPIGDFYTHLKQEGLVDF